MYNERNHIKVFVSSTVYDFESQLDMVYSTLDGYGYDVNHRDRHFDSFQTIDKETETLIIYGKDETKREPEC